MGWRVAVGAGISYTVESHKQGCVGWRSATRIGVRSKHTQSGGFYYARVL